MVFKHLWVIWVIPVSAECEEKLLIIFGIISIKDHMLTVVT